MLNLYLSFSNERLNRTTEENTATQNNDVLQNFTAARRRSERIRRNTTRAAFEARRAALRERRLISENNILRATYRPQQPSVPQVRRMINESNNRARTSTRTGSFQVVSASSIISPDESPEQQRPTPRVGSGRRSSSRPMSLGSRGLLFRSSRAGRPERQPETARRARLQATRDARVRGPVMRAEQRPTADEQERIRPQNFLQYRAWLDGKGRHDYLNSNNSFKRT